MTKRWHIRRRCHKAHGRYLGKGADRPLRNRQAGARISEPLSNWFDSSLTENGVARMKFETPETEYDR